MYHFDYWKDFNLTNFFQNEVGKYNKRKQHIAIARLYLGKKAMAKQAKTLTQTELRRVLDYIATRKHSTRNRALLMTTFLSGVRVGELASLKYKDVVDADGNIRNEIRLSAEQTKGNEERVVFVNDKLFEPSPMFAGKAGRPNKVLHS